MTWIFTMPCSSNDFEKDIFITINGTLEISFIKHGTLMFKYNKMIIHVDPSIRYTDYSKLPKADLILITHKHGDHLDTAAIKLVSTPKTRIIASPDCSEKINNENILKNGESSMIDRIKIETVPAYNIVHERRKGIPYHPKGDGNGYILNFGDFRVFVAGDTENIPEFKELKNIKIAFLPMNLPYTMTPEMVANGALMFKPEILYPYHYGETDTSELLKLMKDNKDTEVRIRQLQ